MSQSEHVLEDRLEPPALAVEIVPAPKTKPPWDSDAPLDPMERLRWQFRRTLADGELNPLFYMLQRYRLDGHR